MRASIRFNLALVAGCLLAAIPARAGALDANRALLRPATWLDDRSGDDGAYAAAPGDRADYRADYRRYYPERGRRMYRRDNGVQGWLDVRGGVFDTDGVSKNDWTLGVKGMGKVTPELSLGLSTDLHRRTHADRVVTSEYTDPTGHVVTTSSTALDAESNLVPLMGVLEVHVPSVGIDPYFGAAAGWEFLNVHVRDFQTGFEGDANYDGPGYQVFGGLGAPIGDRARFVAEAYWNGSTVKRDVVNPQTGYLEQERVDVNGVGARAGLGFAF